MEVVYAQDSFIGDMHNRYTGIIGMYVCIYIVCMYSMYIGFIYSLSRCTLNIIKIVNTQIKYDYLQIIN